GDTVGDPFKDTSGPSMNILIKLMSSVSLVIAPHIAVEDVYNAGDFIESAGRLQSTMPAEQPHPDAIVNIQGIGSFSVPVLNAVIEQNEDGSLKRCELLLDREVLEASTGMEIHSKVVFISSVVLASPEDLTRSDMKGYISIYKGKDPVQARVSARYDGAILHEVQIYLAE
ncbi:MAG: sodium/proton-translocating pyrophosphatase, partial [Thermaurantimonas sp.]